jgi:hypothetical protein
MRDPDKPGHGGYAEGGPGRGDYAGRGDGKSKEAQADAEGELSQRSRWRDADADERSDRWADPTDDALDPEVPDRGTGESGEAADPDAEA